MACQILSLLMLSPVVEERVFDSKALASNIPGEKSKFKSLRAKITKFSTASENLLRPSKSDPGHQ